MYSASGIMAVMALDLVSCADDTNAELDKACQDFGKLKKISQAYVAQHMGKWYQRDEQSPICGFSSSIQAVNCAIDIQRYINEQTNLFIQIGIHTGETILHTEKIEGAAKETAFKICAETTPGGVCVSSSVFESIQQKCGIQLEMLQSTHKNSNEYSKLNTQIYQVISDGLKIKEKDQGFVLTWYYFLIILMLAFSFSGIITTQLFP